MVIQVHWSLSDNDVETIPPRWLIMSTSILVAIKYPIVVGKNENPSSITLFVIVECSRNNGCPVSNADIGIFPIIKSKNEHKILWSYRKRVIFRWKIGLACRSVTCVKVEPLTVTIHYRTNVMQWYQASALYLEKKYNRCMGWNLKLKFWFYIASSSK